ncbi:hypothetical protein BCR21_09615 [Enterococcus ureasiticus]|uniref:Nucleoside 2-deoxyribosyltransferase n=1 Tax=Enterococcus ureasiticus TaxID=903984 RepID=A0A1E5GGD5_9ENTE|nr:hypothetical protein BCR21_09615 [Enterococcus ureasiticus]
MKVITLCGPIKFMKEFRQTEEMLTRMGFAVISPFFFEQGEGVGITKEEAWLLGRIHYKKIAISDGIFVIDVDGYIGESTKKEIEYAKLNNKTIRYYSDKSTL